MNKIDNTIAILQQVKERIDNETRAIPYGEAAYILNKSKRTIRRYIEEGKLHRASANGVNGVWAKEVYGLALE